MLDATKSQMRTELPALAVEPNGRRAVVVPASGPLVDVDLNRLTAFSHTLLTRTPAAIRKTSEGSDRDAVWTYWNTIAVSGSDWTGEGHAWRPAPTTLVDAVNWTTRPLRATASVSTNGYSLVGWGSTWDGVTRRFVGTGLTGYDGNGAERFHLFGEDPVSLATVAGTYAYVASGDLTRFQIVDTESGKILTTLRTSRPTTLAPSRDGL